MILGPSDLHPLIRCPEGVLGREGGEDLPEAIAGPADSVPPGGKLPQPQPFI
jgi:hypothetical protein